MVIGITVQAMQKVVIVLALVDMVELIVQKKNVQMVIGIAIPVIPEVVIVVAIVDMVEPIVQ